MGNWTRHTISAVKGDVEDRCTYDAGADYLHHPEGMQILDLDRDGDMAGVVAELFFGEDPGDVFNWYESPGWTRHTVGEADANGGVLFDVDGDDDMDVISSVYSQSHRTYWFENPADPTQPNWTRRVIDDSSGLTFQHDLEIGDVDMDGADDDSVVLHDDYATGQGILKWYRLPADPRTDPWEITPIADGTVGGVGLAIGDVNGDDRNDVVRGGQWYQAPNPATSTWTEHTATAQHLTNVRLADLDGDGDLDVAGAEGWEESGPLLWLENGENGASWTPHPVATLYHPENLVVLDVDRSGTDELITGEMRDANAATFLIFEQAGGWTRQVVDDSHGVCARMNGGDVDGDGDLDVVCDGDAEDHIYLWINAGCRAEPEPQKRAWARTPAFGETVTYTIPVRNLTVPLTATLALTDVVPTGLAYLPGTLTATAGTVDGSTPPP